MNKEFDIQEYMTRGVERVVSDAVKATLKNPSIDMKRISGIRKNASYILKTIVVISATVGIILSALAGRSAFMSGTRTFMYFTTQSNIAIAIICAAGLILLMRKKAVNDILYIVKFVGTVSITLTGVVFVAVLAPTLGTHAWSVHNVLTHVIVPVASIADFFVVCSGAGIKRKNVIYVIIPPLLYAAYAGIAYVRGWQFSTGRNYPYFFLNWGSPAGAVGFTGELPFMGCVWWIIALFIFLILIGHVYLIIADRIGD